MGNGNVRVRERFELALDGGQIATIVVGALVTVSVVFVLGLKMGQHLAARQALARPVTDIAALDRPVVTETAMPAPALQYAEKLPSQRPAPPPPLAAPRPSAAPAAAAAAAPPPAAPPPPAAAVSPAAIPAAARAAAPGGEVVVPAPPRVQPPAAATAQGKGFTVQIASESTREDATRTMSKVRSHGPRIVEADVPGKGHFFRVRVGRFESREAAERFRDDLLRETGVKGVIMPE